MTSAFQGGDLPDPFVPGQYDTYNLYNIPAYTTGTVTTTPSGLQPLILAPLRARCHERVAEWPLLGDHAVRHLRGFQRADPSFPDWHGVSDPSGSDAVNIYVKNDFGPSWRARLSERVSTAS